MQLGRRHYYFGGDVRFQPIYWDIFVLAGTRAVEELGAKANEVFVIQVLRCCTARVFCRSTCEY